MRILDLFASAPENELIFEDEALADSEEFGEIVSADAPGLRIVDLADCDPSIEAQEVMESGTPLELQAKSVSDLEKRLVSKEQDFMTRVALVDLGAGATAQTVRKAVLSDADLLVIGPMGVNKADSEIITLAGEAASAGQGVFLVHA